MPFKGGLRRIARGGLFSVWTTVLVSGNAYGQSATAPLAGPPPTRAIDSNGVDLISGQPVLDSPVLSSAGIERKASHFRQLFYDNFTSYLPGPSPQYTNIPYDSSPIIAGHRAVMGSDIFRICDPSNNCDYVDRDGTVYKFDGTKSSDGGYQGKPSIAAMVTQVIKPDGEVLNITYATAEQPFPPTCQTQQGPCAFDTSIEYQNKSVASSNGWMVKYDITTTYENQFGTSVPVLKANRIYIINTSVDYCDPNASSCTASDAASWPTFNVVPTSTATTYTDVNNQPVGTYGNAVSQTPSGIQRSFDQGGNRVNSASLNGSSSTYTYSWAATTAGSAPYIITGMNRDKTNYSARSEGAYFQYNPPQLIMYTDSNGQQVGVIKIDTTPIFFYLQQISSFTDELNRVTKYEYNDDNTAILADNRTIKRVILPEATFNGATLTGGYTEYGYDSRHNITKVSVYPKNSGTVLITTYQYETSCTYLNYKYCNKPEAIIDADGDETDYLYYAANGEINTETKPADANGIRPQIHYTYTQLVPRVKNASGSLVNSTPVWRLTKISTCRSSTSSCSGTSDETVTTYAYNTANLLRTSITVAAGNANPANPYSNTNVWHTTCYGYDNVGNVVMVDGPRTDVDDKKYTTYDVRRRVVYEISPDPDGSGSLRRPTVHHLYDNDNRDYRTETGTCGSITFVNSVPTNCSDFAISRYVHRTYDPDGNLVETDTETVP